MNLNNMSKDRLTAYIIGNVMSYVDKRVDQGIKNHFKTNYTKAIAIIPFI